MTDREKLIELIQSAVRGVAKYWAGLIADHLIANGVTVQKHGRWVAGYRCSLCGEDLSSWADAYYETNYCPNCGADMRGDCDE